MFGEQKKAQLINVQKKQGSMPTIWFSLLGPRMTRMMRQPESRMVLSRLLFGVRRTIRPILPRSSHLQTLCLLAMIK